jgi:hypothetical protein
MHPHATRNAPYFFSSPKYRYLPRPHIASLLVHDCRIAVPIRPMHFEPPCSQDTHSARACDNCIQLLVCLLIEPKRSIPLGRDCGLSPRCNPLEAFPLFLPIFCTAAVDTWSDDVFSYIPPLLSLKYLTFASSHVVSLRPNTTVA